MKFNLKSVSMLLLSASLFLVSCEDEGDDSKSNTTQTVNENEVVVSENITSNTTWSKDKTYILASRVAVVSGATLTIEAGTVIKGKAGDGANATALVVARGAKIMAEGTETEPIIFTSTADDIESGQIVSPNMPASLSALWGGVIVLGNANASLKGGVAETSIEGIPGTDPNGLYGGSNDDDNSGILKYVSIRHGGANIGEGNEINGLTLGGVGRGTTIENIEIVGTQDDGVEFFGGTVNAKNVIVWNNGDDAIDTDQAWAGTLDNFVLINPGDKAFELDGPEGSYEGAGHTIIHGTVFANGAAGLVDWDDNTDVNLSEIYFTDLVEGQTNSGYAGYAANAKGFVSSNIQMTLPTVDPDGNAKTYTIVDFCPDGSDAISTEVSSSNVTNLGALRAWSFAGQTNQF